MNANYNFDTLISRQNTNCHKHDTAWYYDIPEDAIPLWVADMDFETAPCIANALQTRANHPVYGYTYCPDTYYEAIIQWMHHRHQWLVEKDWIVTAPSIVAAFNLICQYFLSPGDYVLVQNPVYHPFKSSALNHQMQVMNNPLHYHEGRYEIDFADFESKVSDPKVKLFILCNPHNPVGRAWSKSDLERMGHLCAKHGVLIISDEIHHDLVYPDATFTCMGTLDDTITDNLIVCTSTGKTFNLSSLSCGNIIIKNPIFRDKFKQALTCIGFQNLSPFIIDSTISGYTAGGPWVDALMGYLTENKAYVENYIMTYVPPIKVVPSEATYLMWLDCSALNLSQDELMTFLSHEAKLWVNSGTLFGEEGTGFIRLNIATQKAILIQAMNQLKEAVAQFIS